MIFSLHCSLVDVAVLLEVTPNDEDLDADSGSHEYGRGEGDQEDLDVKNIEPQPDGNGERPPGLEHVDGALVAVDPAAPEGTVKRHNGALVGWQRRGLDTGQDRVRGDHERRHGREPGDAQGNQLEDVNRAAEVKEGYGNGGRCVVVSRRVPREFVDLEGAVEHKRQLLSDSYGKPHSHGR